MKMLRPYDFVSERVKVRPVTNAELDAVKKFIYEFSKADLKTGYVLKTHRGKLQMYMSYDDMMDIPEIYERFLTLAGKKEGIFFKFNDERYLRFLPVESYDNSLAFGHRDCWFDEVYPVEINVHRLDDITVVTDAYMEELIKGISPIIIKH